MSRRLRASRYVVAVLTGLVLTGCAPDAEEQPEQSPEQQSGGQSPEQSPGTREAALGPREYAARLVAATQETRVSLDLPELSPSSCAEHAARERAADLVGRDRLEHAPLGDVIRRCAPGGRAAENLVDSDATPDDVVDAWMESPGHRNNIVDPGLREIGIGCVESGRGMLCSQVFLADR